MSSPLDQYLPQPDIRERFSVRVKAPADLVFEVATTMDLQSLPLVRAIFRLREFLMRAKPVPRQPQGMLDELRSLGWGILEERPGRLVAGGAVCQPWKADVVFRPVEPGAFAAFAEPDQVKIAWTFEAAPLGPALTRFSSETRAVATDEGARRKFRRYWRWARFGIITIRLLLLPAVRGEAEQRWQRPVRGE